MLYLDNFFYNLGEIMNHKAPRNLFDHIILRPTVFGPQNLHQSMMQVSVADAVRTCNWKNNNNTDFHCLFFQIQGSCLNQ